MHNTAVDHIRFLLTGSVPSSQITESNQPNQNARDLTSTQAARLYPHSRQNARDFDN